MHHVTNAFLLFLIQTGLEFHSMSYEGICLFFSVQLFLNIYDFMYLNYTPQFSVFHVFSCYMYFHVTYGNCFAILTIALIVNTFSVSARIEGEGLFKNRIHCTFLEYHAVLCTSAVS